MRQYGYRRLGQVLSEKVKLIAYGSLEMVSDIDIKMADRIGLYVCILSQCSFCFGADRS